MPSLAEQAYGKLSLNKHLEYASIQPGARDPVTGEVTQWLIRRRWVRDPLPGVSGFQRMEDEFAPPIDADVQATILGLLQERVVGPDAVKLDVTAEPLP